MLSDVVSRPSDLPEYDRPPIDEVAMALQFSPPAGFSQAHLGGFWDIVRERYPTALDQPPLPPPNMPFLFGSALAPMFRTWFISSDDSEIVQVQHDRFVRNWRRRDAPYPRFEPLLEAFVAEWGSFANYLMDRHLAPLTLSHIELTYINWSPITELTPQQFLRPFADVEAIEQQWSGRFEWISDRESELTVHSQPAFREVTSQPEPGQQLVITARAMLDADTQLEQVEELFNEGRSAIVRTFTSLTTEQAQKHWGRTK